MADFPLPSIGVDIVALERIKQFLQNHQDRAWSKILSKQEITRYHPRSRSVSLFAKLFAAKEAFFKTLDAAWMGIEGFQKIDVKISGEKKFSASSSAFGRSRATAEGVFLLGRGWVAAQVIKGRMETSRRTLQSKMMMR